MRYRCLVLDHDDTLVNSTAHVHYPAFLAAMDALRPGVTMTLDEYFAMNFDPGFMPYLEDTLKFTDEETSREYDIWQSFATTRVPEAYPGMDRLVRRQKQEGGYVCVISHSVSANIRRDYRENGLPEPDLVFGWDLPKEKRKPSPWALEEIMRSLSLAPQDLLVVDDLKPGYEMARAGHVDFAAAMWAHHVPGIRFFMKAHADFCLETPEDLYTLQFADGNM